MKYERKRHAIVITPEDDADEAFIEDSLGLKPGEETRAIYLDERAHLGTDKKTLVVVKKGAKDGDEKADRG